MPPAEAREFCDWLQSEAAGGMDGVCFSVLALGDRCSLLMTGFSMSKPSAV